MSIAASGTARRLAGVLLVVAAGSVGCESRQPNVILISMDTTRADRLGVYGHDAATTPNIDRFAERATVYESAYSTASWTMPAHASMFTGLLPMQHGVGRESDGDVHGLEERFDTLAERLRAAGYRTVGIISAHPLKRNMGFAQGFEVYDDAVEGVQTRTAEETANRALAIVRARGDAPYFLFVHFWDPHLPYRPPAPFDEGLPAPAAQNALKGVAWSHVDAGDPPIPRSQLDPQDQHTIEGMLQSYDAEIRYMDHHIGRLLEGIDASPRAEDTLVVLTSDHGESFGEHWYFGHTSQLYEQFVRVPLIVRMPGQTSGERRTHLVQTHQLFATILDRAGLAVGPDAEATLLEQSPGQIVTEVDTHMGKGVLPRFDYGLRALYAPPYKIIRSSKGRTWLFDLETDPDELRDLGGAQPDRRRALESELDDVVARHAPRYERKAADRMDPATAEALRALGYLE